MSRSATLGCLGIVSLSLMLCGCTTSTPTNNGQTPAATNRSDSDKDKSGKTNRELINPPRHDRPDR